MNPFQEYLGYLLRPFFRSWWAVGTGAASVLALYVTPNQGITVSGPLAMSMTFLGFALVFLVLTTLTQGWRLYESRLEGLRVQAFERTRDLADDWVFVLEGRSDVRIGTVLDIQKRAGVAEVPLAAVHVTARHASGAYQAVPVGGLNPAHVREHAAGGLRPEDLIVREHMSLQRIREVAVDLLG